MLRNATWCVVLFLVQVESLWAQVGSEPSWRFAVSGDSRNCGDVVMPAIAKSVQQHQIDFYWHLGDFRAMYDVDEDLQKRYADKLTLEEYRQIAWGDFIENQVRPFEPVPVRLGIGNHELIGKTAADYLSQFGYWLDTPELREQRANEFSQDGSLKPYYHWRQHNVDFIYLDNSSDDGFDDAQLQWFEHVLQRDKTDNDIMTVVVGMHRALPNSLACGQSMNGDANSPSDKGTKSGRRAYGDLVRWRHDTRNKKFVYILASHSHFFMQDLYDTPYWQNPEHGEVLPGWIIGTAGARRYQLPAELTAEMRDRTKAEPYVWGYLLGTASANGEINFEFIKLGQDGVPKEVRKLYGDKFVDDFCFSGNKDDRPHPAPPSCKDQ